MFSHVVNGSMDKTVAYCIRTHMAISLQDSATVSVATAAANSSGSDIMSKPTNQFALLEFEKPVTCPTHSLVIGSRLDTDAYIQHTLNTPHCPSALPKL